MNRRVLCCMVVLAWGAAPAGAQELKATPSALGSETVCWNGEPASLEAGFYGEVDYLLWWVKTVCLPPAALTTGSGADPIPGAVGQPNTRVVLGEHKFDFGVGSGIRVGVGGWLDADKTFALEGSGFLIERLAANQSFSLPANSTLPTFLPFKTAVGTQSALPLSTPDVSRSSALAVGSARLWGAEANVVACLLDGPLCPARADGQPDDDVIMIRWSGLVGFRFLSLEYTDTLTNRLEMASSFSQGSNRFSTQNRFYGGQVGTRLDLARHGLIVSMIGKVAVGTTNEAIDVLGIPSPTAGPFFALPTNAGRRTGSDVAAAPEATMRVAYRLTDHLTLTANYTYIGWTSVLCPGDQIDSRLNPTQLPGRGPFVGPALPAPQFVHTDFWTHGLGLGAEIRF